MDALTITREPGRAPHLRAPIPRLSVVTLPALFAVTAREWVTADAEDLLTVCGHEFVPIAWVDLTPPGLLLEHACCGGGTPL